MEIKEYLNNKGLSIYKLAKLSDVPYTTVNDIIHGRTRIEKCLAETVYKLAKALGVTMEELVEPGMENRANFEIFKSHVCHQVKRMGDLAFIKDVMINGTVWEYYNKKWYPESLYLVAMLDYLSRVNEIPQCTDFDELRCIHLDEPIYPSSVLAAYNVTKDEDEKTKAVENAIPEFLRFNIIEGDIRNVI